MNSNGYFSFNKSYNYRNLPHIPLKPSKLVIAPFALDYDTTYYGNVWYFIDTTGTWLVNVSDFISKYSGNENFFGTWGVVVEWDSVNKQGSMEVSLNYYMFCLIH